MIDVLCAQNEELCVALIRCVFNVSCWARCVIEALCVKVKCSVLCYTLYVTDALCPK